MAPEASPSVMAGDDRICQLLFDLSRDAILTIEPRSGDISACNSASVQLFLASGKEELLTKKLSDLSAEFQPDGQTSVQRSADVFEKALMEGQIAFAWRCRRCTGQEFPASVLITTIEAEGNKIFWITIRDTSAMERLRETHQATQQQLMAAEEELQARYNDLRSVENELRASEAKYRMLAETSQDLIYVINAEDRIEYVNSYAAAALGKTYGEIIGRDRHAIFPEGTDTSQCGYLQRIFATGKPERYESQVPFTGRTRWFDHVLNPLKDSDGTVRAVLCISRDITGLKTTEKALKASLEAKDALLREIHHRVKNNMQVVIGLLHFQASAVASPEIARIVLDTETRIRSMVLIHERLYKSDDFINVSLETYLKDLVNSLIHAYGTKTYINVEYSIDKIQIDQSTLLHLGLLITEVISNSIRHAFPGRSVGTISVSFHRQNHNCLALTIHDDGIGIPESCMRGKASTVGLALIYLLGQDQLDGKIRIERNQGTTFTFMFHYSLQKEES